jgi:hypothetical protein
MSRLAAIILVSLIISCGGTSSDLDSGSTPSHWDSISWDKFYWD